MADDKKVIFSMVGVSKIYPPQKQVLKNIYLSFFYGAKIGIIGLNGSGKSSLLKIIAGIDVPGYATTIILILFLGGMQLFCLGIIGEYVGRTFEQTKNRPVYLTKEILNYEEND